MQMNNYDSVREARAWKCVVGGSVQEGVIDFDGSVEGEKRRVGGIAKPQTDSDIQAGFCGINRSSHGEGINETFYVGDWSVK